MPNRKQRRRRDKDFRHDVRVYEIDEEGNEVAISELRAPKDEKAPAKKAKASSQKAKPARGIRVVQPPSWRRAIKRGGMMGGVLLLAFLFVLKSGPLAQRLAIGLFYALALIPFTYFVDRTAYRSYLKRLNNQSSAKPKPAPKS